MPVQRILVVGESKSGKTALIDSLLGYNLLPINTPNKRTVDIKVVHSLEVSSPSIEFGDGQDAKSFTNVSEAKKYLAQLQNETPAQEVGGRIRMTVTSNQSPDMMIIDTIPADDQNPQSIETVKRLMSDSTCLILLVINAKVLNDKANVVKNKWFELVKKADYDLSRTICVFTQCDSLPGSYNYNAMKYFLRDKNEQLNLKLGFVCCRCNLSQSNYSPADVSHLEHEYFSTHKVFQFISTNDFFTLDTVAEKITKYISETFQFKKNMIQLYQQLIERKKINDKELAKYGNDFVEYSDENKSINILLLFSAFCNILSKGFNGKSEIDSDNQVNGTLKSLTSGFLTKYLEHLPSTTAKNEEIITIIQRTEGSELGGFPSGDVVFSILDSSVEDLRVEIKEFLDNVYSAINEFVKQVIIRIFGRFPKMLNQLEELILGFLEKQFSKTKMIVLNIAEMNFNYLYIDEKSESFQKLLKETLLRNITGIKKNQPGQANQNNPQGQQQRGNANNNKNNEYNPAFLKDEAEIGFHKAMKDKNSCYKSLAEYVKSLVDYVYQEILKNLREYIPKSINYFFVDSLKNDLGNYLSTSFSKNQEMAENLEEDKDVTEKRNYYLQANEVLKRITKQIHDDESLMRIIQGDSFKAIDNVVQAQMKTPVVPQQQKPDNKQNAQQKEPEKTGFLSNIGINNIFGAVKQQQPQQQQQNANANKPQQQPQQQQQTQQKSSTSNFFGFFGNKNQQNKPAQQQPTTQSTTQQQQPQKGGMDVNFKFDPSTNQVKDINVKANIDAETAKKIYENNKEYLPTGAQVRSGLKAVGNFFGQVASNMAKDSGNSDQPKKDPLSSLFGTGAKKSDGGSGKGKGMF